MMSPDPPLTRRRDRYDALAITVLCVALALPLRGLMRYQGPTMEEGFMLAFPEMVLNGMVPNRDFLHLYGPGGLWVLAGSFKAFGVSLATERLVGFAQHCGIVFGLFALTRRFGRPVAVVVALSALMINIAPTGLTALAWNGAVAFGLWALWCVLRARDLSEGARADRLLVIGGLCASMALLYRPDLVLAATLGLGAALWGLPRARLRWFAAGLSLVVVGYLAHAAVAGPVNAFTGMVIDPVFRLRDGRSLPMPPAWGHLSGYLQKAAALRTLGWPFPRLALSHQLVLWFYATLLGAVAAAAVGVRWLRRHPEDPVVRTVAAVGLFGLGMCAQALQRVDQAHLSWVSCVTLAFVPAVAAHAVWRRRPSRRRELGAALGCAFVVLCVIAPQYTVRGYVDVTSQSFGKNTFGASVNRGGRNFYLASEQIAADGQALVDGFDALGPEPGERLFVGPVDLRHTPYNDAFFYFLYPELTPATYFVEMDPFDSNEGSRLADDVASADWLILSNVWNDWKEPNASSRLGSDAPNQVVRDRFCKRGEWGDLGGMPTYELYQRCEDGA